MPTVIRPELSKKNPYWIERYRYYELKYFCLQYPIWNKAYRSLDGLSKQPNDLILFKNNEHGDPTARCAVAREYYRERMEMIEQTAMATDGDLASYILEAVTTGLSYRDLKARLDIPCSKDVYYHLYRKFFWLLNERRN